jgi:hypothetical protein
MRQRSTHTSPRFPHAVLATLRHRDFPGWTLKINSRSHKIRLDGEQVSVKTSPTTCCSVYICSWVRLSVGPNRNSSFRHSYPKFGTRRDTIQRKCVPQSSSATWETISHLTTTLDRGKALGPSVRSGDSVESKVNHHQELTRSHSRYASATLTFPVTVQCFGPAEDAS